MPELSDIHPKAERRYLELLRASTMEQRWNALSEVFARARVLCELGLRSRHPAADDEEIRKRLAVRLYGRKTAERLAGALPDDAV